ncbi:nucleolar protein 58-like [Mercenaria mercenaria]|uniref:nucleolar protein 58-like n=1 Tax=Mercenaria mercenaria TaxID=6596 RepID=UPI00234E87E7|nr:nucleolar protein 58-like [Mercenaria mercenaria]
MKQIGIILLVGLLIIGTEAWHILWNTKIVKRDAYGAVYKEDDAKDSNAITGNGDSNQDKKNSIADVKVDTQDVVGKHKADNSGQLEKTLKMKDSKRKEKNNKSDDLAALKREKHCGKKIESQRVGQGMNKEDQSRMEKCLNKEACKGRRRKNKKNQSNDKKKKKNEDSGQTGKKYEGNGKTRKKNGDNGKNGNNNEDNEKTKKDGRRKKEKENNDSGKKGKKNEGRRKKEKENDDSSKKGKKNDGSGKTEKNSAGRRKKEKESGDSGYKEKGNKVSVDEDNKASQ